MCLSFRALFIQLISISKLYLGLVTFRQILAYLPGSVQICTDSQGVINMGNECPGYLEYNFPFSGLGIQPSSRIDAATVILNEGTSMANQCQFNDTQNIPVIHTCSMIFAPAKIDHVTMFNCSSEGTFFLKLFHRLPSLVPFVEENNFSFPNHLLFEV